MEYVKSPEEKETAQNPYLNSFMLILEKEEEVKAMTQDFEERLSLFHSPNQLLPRMFYAFYWTQSIKSFCFLKGFQGKKLQDNAAHTSKKSIGKLTEKRSVWGPLMASIMAQSQLPSMLPNSADVTEKKSAKWQDLGSTEKQSLFLSVTYNNIVNDISVAVNSGHEKAP